MCRYTILLLKCLTRLNRLKLNTLQNYFHHSENIQKPANLFISFAVPLRSRWLGCACSKLLQLHFCCSLLLLDDNSDFENICMWFLYDSLQPGVPAFDVIVCSRPIIIAVVPLMESEFAINPDS